MPKEKNNLSGRHPLTVITKGSDPYENTLKALDALSLPPLQGKKILLKPNAGRCVPARQGVTTHPQVVAAAIDFFQKVKPATIFLGESPILGVKALDALEKAEMAEIARKKGVCLIDLDERTPFELPIPRGKLLKKLLVCALVKEVDYLVSIPVNPHAYGREFEYKKHEGSALETREGPVASIRVYRPQRGRRKSPGCSHC